MGEGMGFMGRGAAGITCNIYLHCSTRLHESGATSDFIKIFNTHKWDIWEYATNKDRCKR